MAQLRIPLDAQRFAKGLTWKDYMAQMGDTRARTEDNYQKSVLTEEERKFFGGISQVRYVLMLAENWCGDVHRNSPLIAHIAEAMPNCETARVLPRSEPRPDGLLPEQRLPFHPEALGLGARPCPPGGGVHARLYHRGGRTLLGPRAWEGRASPGAPRLANALESLRSRLQLPACPARICNVRTYSTRINV